MILNKPIDNYIREMLSMGQKSLLERVKEDADFAKKLDEAKDEAERQAIFKGEGYSVKNAKDFVDRLMGDAAFKAEFSALKSLDEKTAFALKENYYFTKPELEKEYERIAEEEFETLAGTDFGSIASDCWDLQCFIDTSRQSSCPSHFKCTWG